MSSTVRNCVSVEKKGRFQKQYQRQSLSCMKIVNPTGPARTHYLRKSNDHAVIGQSSSVILLQNIHIIITDKNVNSVSKKAPSICPFAGLHMCTEMT
jgi:hypothetical protein